MESGKIIRLGIIENEKVYADSLQFILSRQPDIEVIMTCYHAEEALQKQNYPIPDVILLDIELGSFFMTGLEAIPKLLNTFPGCQILILTIFEEYEKVYEALQQGALGYILKSDPADKIISAIFELKAGGSPMSPAIARKVIHAFHKQADNTSVLSERENEIIQLIAKGMSEKEVAVALYLSPLTIKKHVSNIYNKLQVNSRMDALNKLFGS